MRAAGALLLVASLVACAPRDPAISAQRNAETCEQGGLAPQRARACSAVIGDRSAPLAERVDALITRGMLRAEEAQYTRAIGDFGRALRLDPDNIQALLERGGVHERRAAYDAAVRDYDAILRLHPTFQLAAQRREQALAAAAGAFSAERAQLDRQIAATPNNAALLNSRCWLRAINSQELELALADCNESLRIRPNTAAVLDSRGLVNYKLGRYEASLADYEAALAIEPNTAHYAYGRGATLIALGREAEGRAALQQAVTEDDLVRGMYLSYGVSP